MPFRRPIHYALVIVFLLSAAAAHAADLRPFEQHVRTTDPSLRTIIRHGVDTSPSFFALVDALTRSDVIVYVQRGQPPPNVRGQLSFVAATAGVRYVRVEVAWNLPPQQMLSTLAHELQHANEVAQTPSIVDEASLGRAFAWIGHERWDFGGQRYESTAAIEAGARVWREFVLDR
jgi:hypothetical protein